ncbi:MAG: hypothetical protein IK123_02440, partial [Lachnospiraceae bacterium]|nr:hypothetical protein [Lachnospiraceae bacterium]
GKLISTDKCGFDTIIKGELLQNEIIDDITCQEDGSILLFSRSTLKYYLYSDSKGYYLYEVDWVLGSD